MKHFTESEIRKNPRLGILSSQIGERISGGADGVVYGFGKDKVIKISKGTRTSDRIFPILKTLNRKRFPFVVCFDSWGKRSGTSYYIVMERLRLISNVESNALYSYNWHGEGWFKLESCNMKRGSVLHGRVRRLVEGMKLFWREGLRYGDFHSGNIMKDRYGEFKFVDPEGFTY